MSDRPKTEPLANIESEAQKLTNLGKKLFSSNQLTSAEENLTKAVSLAYKQKDRMVAGIALSTLGETYIALKQFDRAADCFTSAEKIGREAQIDNVTILALVGQAHLSAAKSQTDKAIELYEKAVEVNPAADSHDLLASLYNDFAGLLYDSGKVSRATEFFEQAVSSARQADDPVIEAKALRGLGLIHFNFRRYNEALDHYEIALARAKASKDTELESEIIDALIEVFKKQGNIENMIKILEMKLDLVRRSPNPDAEYDIRLEFANFLMREQDDLNGAIAQLEAGKNAAQERDDKGSELRMIEGIAKLYRTSNYGTMSVTLYEDMLDIAREMQDRDREFEILKELAAVHKENNQHQRAIDPLTKAIKIIQAKVDAPAEGALRYYLGESYMLSGNAESAKEELERARRLGEQGDRPKLVEAADKLLNDLSGIPPKSSSRW